ncbi:MAG: tripartite tricarboxylate transporter permease [Oscillospiraceae bacterium]|nr:tripartite tricarboxylate transporter permease [Oscillospiraceae bacterium]
MANLMYGFSLLFSGNNFLVLLIGVVVGYFLGIVPGISAAVSLALLIPFTFGMDPVSAMILLTTIYTAINFGGGIPAILLNTPGTPSAAATVLDGYPLAQQGKAKKALGITMFASGIGGFFSVIMMIAFSMPLALFALRFGPPEYFILAIMGLSVVAGLSADNLTKGLILASLGLFLTTVGMDPIGGGFRYVMSFHLLEGIPFVPALIGLFAISEIFSMMEEASANQKPMEKIDGEGITVAEVKSCRRAIGLGSIIGFIVGLIPAAGPNIAAWMSYNEAKRGSSNPENFGKGELAGVAAPETSNNAAAAGGLVPTLALGIPGSPPLAVLIGALTLHGITAGPLLFERNPEVPYSIFATMIIATPLMMILGLVCIKYFALVTLIPKTVLAPIVLGVCTVGSFAVSGTMFGVWAAYIFGVVGYIFKRFGFPIPPIVLALVLGRMAETNFRRSMLMSGGDLSIFVTRPITVVIMLLTILMFVYPLIKSQIKKRKAAAG